MLRVGFAGSGLIAWAHAIGLRAMIQAGVIDAEISVVYDTDGERAARFAGASGATPVSDIEELVVHCDALWVCTPTSAHTEAVEAAARSSRAVFCEKPLAPDLPRARMLADVASSGAVPNQVGLVLRSTPVFRALRELVDSGDLGRPMVAVFRDDQYFPVQGLYASTWRSDSAVAGGGCLIEHSIHDLDILRFCLGEVAEVRCRTSNLSGRGDVEDLASVSLRFASGASADLTSVWHDITGRGSSRRVEVFFEQGLAWLDRDFLGPLHLETTDGARVLDCRSPAWVDELPIGHDETGLAIRMYVEADRSFTDAVVEERPPQPDFAEAIVAHELVDAAYRSARLGGAPVSLP